jgi:hypothetical protein
MTNASNGKPKNSAEGEPNKLDNFQMDKPTVSGTEACKNNSSKKIGNTNALSHGLYSKDVVLPWESQSDFEALLEDLRSEWRPNGRSEEEAVFDLAYLAWLKSRLRKWAYVRFQKQTGSKPSDDDIVHNSEKFSQESRSVPQVGEQENPYKYAQFNDLSDLLTRLDAQIEKTLRRLTSLKVFKHNEPYLVEAPRQIESPPTVPADLPETEPPPVKTKTEH